MTRIIKFQDEYYKTSGLVSSAKSPYTGDRWAKKIIATTWKSILNLWKNRCEHVHGKDIQERRTRAQQQFAPRVRACYSFLPNMPQKDRDLFDSSATETLTKTPHFIETWLLMTEQLIHQVKKEQANPRKYFGTKSIQDYFIERQKPPKTKKTKAQDIRNFFQQTP